MTLSRFLPIALYLVACGGGGGEPSTPPLLISKGTASGDGQSGVVATALPLPLIVKITQDGAPVAGQPVTFAAGGGAGTVLPTQVLTDVTGLAATTWTLGQSSGARIVTVSSPGVTGGPIQFGATALPGAPSSVVASGGQGQVQQAGHPFLQQLTVRVLDVFGNGIPGQSVSWQVTGGSGTVSAPTSLTGATGGAVISVTAGATDGPLAVTATAASLSASPIQFDLVVTPAATTVTVSSNFFLPNSISIPVHGAVVWNWIGGTHNVTQVSGPATFPGSATQGASSTYGPLVFDVAGTYTYECTIHTGMTGTIIVQ